MKDRQQGHLKHIRYGRWDYPSSQCTVSIKGHCYVRFRTMYIDGFAANIYWDLGGNATQFGDPEAVGRLVNLQFKVLALLHDGDLVIADASNGSACGPNHLGSRRYLHSRLRPRPLCSHIQDKIFPHDLLCSPWHQHIIRRCHHFRRMSYLQPDFFPVGSIGTRWPLWRSKIVGSFHWRLQSAN